MSDKRDKPCEDGCLEVYQSKTSCKNPDDSGELVRLDL